MRAAILLLLFSSVVGAQHPAIPPTPAGNSVAQFLGAFNDGKLANDPTWGRFYSLYGPLRFQWVATSQPYDLRVWTRSDVTESWVGVRVILSPDPPHKLQDIRIATGLRPLVVPRNPPLTLDEAIAAIDGYFNRLAAVDAFSGAVLIAKNGVTRYEKAFGYASKRYHVLNDIDTKFNIGSLTKLITAVAVGQLADAGKLSFSDAASRFLPDYPSKATIHQLLTHAAGLGRSRFSRDAFTDRFARSIEEQLPLTIQQPEFAPGTGVNYSNEGFLLLGAIIEKASGENYYEYVVRHIYGPAGMTSSGAFEGDREVPNLATGYTFWRWKADGDMVFEGGERRNTEFMTSLRGNPSGGTYSSVRDLNRFVQALESCALVRCATRDAIVGKQVARPKLPWSGIEEGYGYGVETRTIDGVELVGKSGDLIGVSAQLDLDRSRGFTIIVLSNYDSIAQPAAQWVEETLLQGYSPLNQIR
jgi:CubicO group peptidase (beta-lactamase class C family)